MADALTMTRLVFIHIDGFRRE